MFRQQNFNILMSLMPLVALFLLPFIGSDYLVYLGILFFINAVLGMSLRQVMLIGQLSLGHGAFMAVGAYASALISKSFGLSFWFVMPMSGLVTVIIAIGLGYLTLRIKGAYFAIATFAMGEIVRLVLVAFENPFGGPAGIKGIPAPSLGLPGLFHLKFVSLWTFFYLGFFIFLVAFIVFYSIERSPIGRVLVAIADADNKAESIGINTMGYKVLAFSIGCFFAGIVGSYFAHFMGYISPAAFTMWLSVYILIYVLLGGQDHVVGPIIGAAFLTVLTEFVRFTHQYELILYGFTVILVILLLPRGLISLVPKIQVLMKVVKLSK